MEFFKNEKMSPSTIKITNIDNVFCFLVEGTKKAVLIDTGTGAGDLRGYVEKLTDKPVSVILTHGHCDHASGAAAFDEVFLNKEDWELVKFHASMEMKKNYISHVLGDKFKDVSETDICPERTEGYLPLTDGQIFDLGGITLEAVALPGHTRGMTGILNREERTMLFGDACNPSVFLWDEEASSVEEYLESLEHMKTIEGRYDQVYLSHGAPTVDKHILDNVMEVCREIIQGEEAGQPFSFMEYKDLRIAKAIDENQNRLDGVLGNIVYNPRKIFKDKKAVLSGEGEKVYGN